MNKTTSSPSGTVSRGTAFVLSLIVFVCVTLIGTAGYFKYQLDFAKATLLAPDALTTADHLNAQHQYDMWAMALTLVAWASLIIASALAAGIYLSLRSRNAAPLRALAQSVQNMTRGDMRTPIWGMERSDMVGEVARTIDLARYHFSHLPDVALMSDQGPVRLRFEGNARSLFEAMMQNIARESEQIRAQVQGLSEAINRKNEAISVTAANVESALSAILRNRQTGEEDIQRLLKSVSGSAAKLNSAQEIASSKLNGLVTYLQERAKSMGDLTQIAGKQMAQSLVGLGQTEKTLRESADHSRETVQKLSAAAEEIGERLFGAVTLLRAGGKALTEATESTQSRLNEAIHLLSQSEGSLRQMLAQGFTPVGTVPGRGPEESAEIERLSAIVGGLADAQRKLEGCLAQQTQAAQAQIELLTTQSNSLLTQASTAAQTLAAATDKLRDERDRLGATTGKMDEALEYLGSRLEERAMQSFSKAENALQGLSKLMELSSQLGPVIERLSSTVAANAERDNSDRVASSTLSESVMDEIKMGFEVTSRSIERLREEFLKLALNQPASGSVEAMPSGGWDKITAQIEEARESLTRMMIQQADRLEIHLSGIDKHMPVPAAAAVTEIAQSQLQQQTQILTELAAALGAIDAHMQEMETSFKNLSAATTERQAS